MNRIFWEDAARYLEAWALLTFWRGLELIDPTIDTLNSKYLTASAVLARSVLELAAVLIIESNNFLATVQKLPKPKPNEVVTVEGLEHTILRLIWGTRQDGSPDYLKQKNILGYLRRLSKNQKAAELIGVYEFLCEVAHPNVVGYARFQSRLGRREGHETVVSISRQLDVTESQAGNELLQHILWALGWSAVCLRNGFHIMQKVVYEIDTRFQIRRHPDVAIPRESKIGRNEPCPCGRSGKKFKRCHGA